MTVAERVSLERWRALVGRQLRIHVGPDREIGVELADVQDLGRRERPEGPLDCYALHLVSPEPGHVPQATYRLSAPEIPELEVFLVPIGPGPAGMVYEAIFN